MLGVFWKIQEISYKMGTKICKIVEEMSEIIYLFINIYLINNRMLQILQIYHAGSRVDGPSQVTVASSFLIILLQKSSSPLQVPISNPLLSCTVPSQISRCSWFISRLLEHIQLGQPSVNPPRLVLEVGGTSTLQAAVPVKLKSPPLQGSKWGGTSALQAWLPA